MTSIDLWATFIYKFFFLVLRRFCAFFKSVNSSSHSLQLHGEKKQYINRINKKTQSHEQMMTESSLGELSH